MCGRYTFTRPAKDVAEQFHLPEVPTLEPRYNIAPTQGVFAIRGASDPLTRTVAILRWGLVPSWAKDLSIGNRLLNARAETIEEKSSFRTAFLRRRCLIPADGFYEWKTLAGKKHPIHIRFRDNRLFAFAGLWEKWQSPEGNSIESCTILTTQANELIAPIHERMPVIIPPEKYATWLMPAAAVEQLRPLLTGWPAEEMSLVPANPRVNNARNEGAECLLVA